MPISTKDLVILMFVFGIGFIIEKRIQNITYMHEKSDQDIQRLIDDKASLLLKKYENQLHTEIEKLKRDIKDNQVVAFHVMGSDVSNLGERQVVNYSSIITNIGNGYRGGYFTAPVTGLYLFSFSVMSPPGNQLRLGIVKNGLYIAHGNSDPSGYDQGAQTAVVTLNVGDVVWVIHHFGHKHSEPIHTDLFNSFSGTLISRNI